MLTMILNLSCSSEKEKSNEPYFGYLSDYPNLSRKIFFNLDDAFSYSQKHEKKLLILFTSFGLHSNLRNNVPEWKMLCYENIKNKIENNYTLCLLFVDDPTKVEEINSHSNFTDKRFDTYGEMWSEVEINKFDSNVCPLFVKMNSESSVLYKGKFDDYSKIIEFIK